MIAKPDMSPFKTLSIFLLLSQNAMAESARFTTVFLDDEGVIFAGLKHGDPAKSSILSLPLNTGERTHIPLPQDIQARDVVGIITEKQKIFVITVVSGAPTKNDGPMLHLYDRKTSRWSPLGKLVCPSFTKVTLSHSRMVFSCEVGVTRKGKAKVQRKAILLKKDRLYRKGVWRIPEFLLRYKGQTVLLEGKAPVWDKLRLRSSEGEKTINASDILDLPLPGDAQPGS